MLLKENRVRDFIYSLINSNNVIQFEYQDYNTIFVKEKYDTFYLFFFLQKEEQLKELKKKTVDIYQHIKSMDRQYYDINMDKNTVCIFCLALENEKYYDIENGSGIDDIVKLQCAIEEDLVYFKKNVLLYSEEMGNYARQNVGKFDEMCKQQLKDEVFQQYKTANKSNYKFEFLINLFVKIPFLNFSKYQNGSEKEFKTAMDCINDKCMKENIDVEKMNELMEELEANMEDEESFYLWLDDLVKKEKGEQQIEDTESGDK